MNLITLLGSGVSIPSGLPDVKKLTENILYNEYHLHSDSTFYKGRGQSFDGGFEKSARIQDFLRALKKEIDEINQRESNYEDLYYACNQIYEHSLGEFENPLIVPFLTAFSSNNPRLFETINIIGSMEFDYKILTYYSLIFIQCVVWDSLSIKNEPVGFKLLTDILKSDKFEYKFLVTLNHDLLLEILLKKKELPYNDGFARVDGDVVCFDRSQLDSSSQKIHLIKLHGSLDWFRFRSYENGLSRISYAKLLEYTSEFYKILHNKFRKILSQNSRILITGYGWNDIGINKILFSWIDSKPENTIILLHRNPEKLRSNSKSALINRFDKLVKSSKLILVERWLCDLDFPELLDLSPDIFNS